MTGMQCSSQMFECRSYCNVGHGGRGFHSGQVMYGADLRLLGALCPQEFVRYVPPAPGVQSLMRLEAHALMRLCTPEAGFIAEYGQIAGGMME